MVKDIDIQYPFFHYTNTNNIDSIDLNGLLPKFDDSAIEIDLKVLSPFLYEL